MQATKGSHFVCLASFQGPIFNGGASLIAALLQACFWWAAGAEGTDFGCTGNVCLQVIEKRTHREVAAEAGQPPDLENAQDHANGVQEQGEVVAFRLDGALFNWHLDVVNM